MDQAIGLIDGNWTGFGVARKPAASNDVIEMTFSLPAPTRFDGFAVPNILETPSPSQTFAGTVEVFGASSSVEGPYVRLASAQLSAHKAKGEVTALALAEDQPEVLWVRVSLSGGIDVQTEKSFLEFSEIIGTGSQQTVPLVETFAGVYAGRGVKLELEQNGPVVTGCYDGRSELSGTVQGNVLRALGEDAGGVPSQFILIMTPDGHIHGLRSTNGAPFKTYNGDVSNAPAACLQGEPPKLGCGSIVHGIGFDFDSDRLRPGSNAVIEELYAGLNGDQSARMQIIGHSSSEGEADYNRDLSQRRAQSVVGALVSLGLENSRLSAVGRGEDEPIASNDDEAGRSLNRRVEVRCAN